MDDKAVELRRALARVDRGRGKRYPEQLRKQVIAWATAQHAAGASWEQIKRELGQRFDTVRRWCEAEGAAPPRSRALVAVKVVPDATERRVAVVSPAGFRVEGLTFSEAAALLRELG
ncbi:MAG: hypothetical protein QM756_45435 [Polyangiaceae bacterium]